MQKVLNMEITNFNVFMEASRLRKIWKYGNMAAVRVVHDCTACIYRLNCEKPVSKWSFQLKIQEATKDALTQKLKICSGIVERAQELGVRNYKVKILYKTNIPEPEYRKGRVFAIDSQDQYELPFLYFRINVS